MEPGAAIYLKPILELHKKIKCLAYEMEILIFLLIILLVGLLYAYNQRDHFLGPSTGTCDAMCQSTGPEGCCECRGRYPASYNLHHSSIEKNMRECMCRDFGFEDYCFKTSTNMLLSQ
jgi:hypothetical protein